MAKIYTLNNKIISINNKWARAFEETPPTPTFDEVTIGTQTWMAKNLAIDDGGEGITILDNVTANNVNFGTQYYYNWAAAQRVASSISGWHIPTQAEWNTLLSYVGSGSSRIYLTSTSGWTNGQNGVDLYGFNWLPLGEIYNGTLYSEGSYGYMFSSTLIGNVPLLFIADFNYTAIQSMDDPWGDLYSLRLIKDT